MWNPDGCHNGYSRQLGEIPNLSEPPDAADGSLLLLLRDEPLDDLDHSPNNGYTPVNNLKIDMYHLPRGISHEGYTHAFLSALAGYQATVFLTSTSVVAEFHGRYYTMTDSNCQILRKYLEK